MSYAALLIVVPIFLVALLWDIWIPSSSVRKHRPGTLGVALSVLLSTVSLIALELSVSKYLVVVALGLAMLFCIHPAMVLAVLVKKEIGAKLERDAINNIIRTSEYRLPNALMDVDNNLKIQYDNLMYQLQPNSPDSNNLVLIEQGRLLAEALTIAARGLGFSKAYEMSDEIPALTFWAAQVSKRSYPAEDVRHLAHENSLRYYKNFDSTAWLWETYVKSRR